MKQCLMFIASSSSCWFIMQWRTAMQYK